MPENGSSDNRAQATQSDGASCPCCLGTGQITGPKSVVYRYEPDDPFNRVVRLCDECEGTGIITRTRAAALEANAMQHVYDAIDRAAPDLADRAKAQVEREMRERGIEP